MGKKPPAADRIVERKPAHELLLDFVNFNNLVLIIDEVTATVPSVKDTIFINTKSPRLRVFYSDQITKEAAGTVKDRRPKDHKPKAKKNGRK